MKKKLLLLVVTVILGYVIGRADAAYGHAPWLIVCLVAAVSWLAGAAHTALTLNLQLAEARQERDDACSLAVSMEEGATFEPVPLYVDRTKADRLHRPLRSIR